MGCFFFTVSAEIIFCPMNYVNLNKNCGKLGSVSEEVCVTSYDVKYIHVHYCNSLIPYVMAMFDDLD